jgi:GT2 family glycosyltransferase
VPIQARTHLPNVKASMKKTLIIIITYNGMRWLPDVLAEIGKSPHYDVWVRDNGSTDKTRELLTHHASVSFTSFGSNIGFGRANNEGLSFALEHGYDSVFLLNQDCRIHSDVFSSLRYFGLANQENVTCPVQLNWDGLGVNFNFGARYAPGWASHKESFEVYFVNAAAWFIPIGIIEKVGGFNPVFFMYGEDRDWARRLLAIGGRFTVLPSLFCYHKSSVQNQRQSKIQTNQRIIFSHEVTEFFFSHKNFHEWRKGWFKRALKRSFRRKQLFNTFTLINPIAEVLVYRHFRISHPTWKEVRKQSTFSRPFLLDN